jgi:hypothetical protein
MTEAREVIARALIAAPFGCGHVLCPECAAVRADAILTALAEAGAMSSPADPPSARERSVAISPSDPNVLRASLAILGPSADGSVERDLAAAEERERTSPPSGVVAGNG